MKLDLPTVTPIQIARAWYWQHGSQIAFEEDFRDYLENGIVISRPDIFAMAKVDGDTLFVRMAVGRLRDLLSSLPVLMPWISFYRRNKGQVRKYSLEKMLETTGKVIKNV